jgi:hypothetical protein
MNKNDLQKILEKLNDHEDRIFTLENEKQLKPSPEAVSDNPKGKLVQESLVLKIINKVGDCEESEQIKSKVLDKRSQEAKLLLCLYISYKYFSNQWLNSGDMEKITSELGIKIDTRNITNKLKEIRQYLESGSTRKKGQPTPYRLNRKGTNRFEEILKDK